MELSSFSEQIVDVPYERGGQTVMLQINIDAFTPEFFRQVGETFKERLNEWEAEDKQDKPRRKKNEKPLNFFESSARGLEIDREIHARLLSSGVLKGWDVTMNGEPVQPTFEVLNTQPPSLIKELWETALKAAQTVKKKADEETVETLAYTPNGSKAPSLETTNAQIG